MIYITSLSSSLSTSPKYTALRYTLHNQIDLIIINKKYDTFPCLQFRESFCTKEISLRLLLFIGDVQGIYPFMNGSITKSFLVWKRHNKIHASATRVTNKERERWARRRRVWYFRAYQFFIITTIYLFNSIFYECNEYN